MKKIYYRVLTLLFPTRYILWDKSDDMFIGTFKNRQDAEAFILTYKAEHRHNLSVHALENKATLWRVDWWDMV